MPIEILPEYLSTYPGNNVNEKAQDITKKLIESNCAAVARKAIEATMNRAFSNEQPVNSRFCVAACFSLPNLVAKVTCATLACFCFPCAIAIAAGRESKYEMSGEFQYVCKRIAQSWVDAGITVSAIPANILGTFKPELVDEFATEVLRHYLKEIAETHKHDKELDLRIKGYKRYWELTTKAWKDGSEPPNKKEALEYFFEKRQPQDYQPIEQTEELDSLLTEENNTL